MTNPTPTSGAADLPDAMHMAELLENPINVVCQKTAAPAQPAAQHVTAYAALPESFLEIPDVQDESGINAYYSREVVLKCIDAALASHGQAPAGAAEELALTRQTNLAVVQRLQAKINALEAELDASRKAESQVQSYADELDRRAQYDADNLADACGGYGGERI